MQEKNDRKLHPQPVEPDQERVGRLEGVRDEMVLWERDLLDQIHRRVFKRKVPLTVTQREQVDEILARRGQ